MRNLDANKAVGPSPNKRERLLVASILLLGAVFTFAACLMVHRAETQQQRIAFQRLVESRLHLFESAGINYEELLFSLRNLFTYQPHLSEAQFSVVTRDALKRHPPVQALEWVPKVTEAQRQQMEQQMRSLGHSNFTIFRVQPDGSRAPSPVATEHFPILYAAPLKGNEAALGFDLAFGPTADLLAMARDEADTVLTGKLRLIQESGDQFGLVSIAPVYRSILTPKTVEERREQLIGYVQIVFRLGDLIEGILGRTAPGGADILIEDTAAGPEQRVLYFHSSPLRKTPAPEPTPRQMLNGLGAMHTLRMGERNLNFYFRPAPDWLDSLEVSRLPALASGGILITILIASLFLSLSRRARVIESQVTTRTAELVDANDRLGQENKERQMVEGALRESEARFRSLVEYAPVGVWQLEPDGRRIRYLNPILRKMLGLSSETDVTGKDIRNFIAPEFQQELPTHLETRFRGISSSYEIEYLRTDGKRLPVQVFGAPLRDRTGCLAGIIGLSIDITERRRAKQALVEERQLLRTLIDTLPDPIYVKDIEGRFLSTNDANRKIIGLDSSEEVLGKTVFDYFPKEIANLYHQDDMKVIRSGVPLINHEEPCTLSNGENGWFLTSKVPLRNTAGDIIGLVGISRDITSQKHADEERKKFEQKIQETQKLESLGVLAGGIAHDFNNLLTGILGHASLAKLEFPGNPVLFEHLDQVEKSSQRAADLCRQMLAYAGKGRFIVQNIDVTTLVEEITTLLQLSISKKVVIRFQLAHGLPPVAADATQIRQILMNLVINASDAIGDRSGVINVVTGMIRADRTYLKSTHLSPDMPEGDYVFIEISDSGCGMSKETISRIFDPFFTTKFTGRGLGLAAVIGIVRSHKGALKVYSEEGRGSTFKLLLPCAEGPAAPLEFRGQPPAGWSSHGTILVVDDEETVRAVSARLLESLGFQTILAENGRDAVEKFKANEPAISLVLMDLTMPHMDGEQAFRELRKLKPEIRVLLMSGFNEQDAVNRFTGKGLAGFIQKPFKREELQAKLKAVLEDSASRQA